MAMTQWEIRRKSVGQSNLKIVLCDDDPFFLDILFNEITRLFNKFNIAVAITVFPRPEEILAESLAACDMAFLDIDFAQTEQTGIDIARSLRQENARALIFFITNYIDYALVGYEVQAFRYILKRDVHEVLERYLLQALESIAEKRNILRLRDKASTADLPLDQITFLEVLGHSVTVHAADLDVALSAVLSELERELEEHGFLRIHKSYLVNMAHIRKFRSRECLLLDGTTLAVSEKNYSQQKQKYLLWKGLK